MPKIDSDTVVLVIDRLVGDIYPIGDSTIDEQRYENLKLMEQVLDILVGRMSVVAKDSDSPFASCRRLGDSAESWMSDTKEYLACRLSK